MFTKSIHRLALLAILAALLSVPSTSFSEPLRISDNPVKSCAAFLNMSEHDQQIYGAGFFAALSRGSPLVWYAVATRRTFSDDLLTYCRKAPGAMMQSIAYQAGWQIYFRAPEQPDAPLTCDTCE